MVCGLKGLQLKVIMSGRYNSSFCATNVHRPTCQGWVVVIVTRPLIQNVYWFVHSPATDGYCYNCEHNATRSFVAHTDLTLSQRMFWTG